MTNPNGRDALRGDAHTAVNVAGHEVRATTTEDHPRSTTLAALASLGPFMGSAFLSAPPGSYKYRPDVSLGRSFESTRERTPYRRRGLGITRAERNPRR